MLVLNRSNVQNAKELVEADLRMREDRAGLMIERAVAILTQIPLIHPIATVFDH